MINDYVYNPYLMSDDVFGRWYSYSNLRRKRNRQFRHLEKYEKGYRRKR